MGLRKEYVRLLSKRIVDGLVKREMIEVPEGLDLAEELFQVMDAEINLEDKLNEEVRTMLNQYAEQMAAQGRIDATIALWVPFLLLGVMIAWMYHVVAHKPGGQPIGALEWFAAKLARRARSLMPKPAEA